MRNYYTFHCPVAGSDQALERCEERHGKAMQGKHDEIEALCSVAHQCYMCPVRGAFRVSGPWRNPQDKPRWDEPREKAAKLPPEIVEYALGHTGPSTAMYRRAGAEIGIFDDHLTRLREGRPVLPGSAPKPKEPSKPAKGKAPRSNADALDQVQGDSYADAITEAVAESKKAPEKPEEKPAEKPERKRAASTPEKPKARTSKQQGASDAPSKPKLSLAERAKLIKQRKAG